MGVSCVTYWNPPSGKNPSQGVDILQQRLELLGAQKSGGWTIECDAYQSQSLHGSPMYIVRVSEYPHSTFVILDAGPCIVADSSIAQIIDRLASFYQPKASNASQVKGYKYRLGDYAIRIGIATIGQSVKGVLIEIEALPFVDPSICWKSLTEFIGRLVDGSLVLPAVAPVPRSSDKQYSPLDTAMQYVSVFDEMRSAKTA